MNVAVLGASCKTGRYSRKALATLRQYGHRVWPVNPNCEEIDGVKTLDSLNELPEPVDTITVYVSPRISSELTEEIAAARPRRVIFNPGAENPTLAERLVQDGVEVQKACTLVLLSTNQF